MLGLKAFQKKWNRKRVYKNLLDKQEQLPITKPMIDYLQIPEPDPMTAIDDNEYLVVDIETTGLSHTKDDLLSIGFVLVVNGMVELNSAYHAFIKTEAEVGQSATIHGIHDQDIAKQGQDIEDVMAFFLNKLKGRVLIVHYAGLDYSFLTKTTKELYGTPLLVTVIDTLEVEKKRQQRSCPEGNFSLRLDDCRERYGLPRYGAHNALTDAIATAELWLAQMSHLQKREQLKLHYFN
jgi:DNA polymerase-3 subunit epsilon